MSFHVIIVALNMSSDICGATFMAGATSSPELFVNVIGTFITEGLPSKIVNNQYFQE